MLRVFSGQQSPLSSLLAPRAAGGIFPADAAAPSLVSTEVVPLEEVLERLPADVEVPFLKTDVQGADLEAVLSAGLQIRRVSRIQVECQDLPPGHADLLYAGQPTKRDFISPLRAAGFVLERCWENNPPLREENCMFARNDLVLRLDSGCFRRIAAKKPWTHETPLEHLEEVPGALDGPHSVARANRARIAEHACCGSRPWIAPLDDCFDEFDTISSCCLRAYFVATDYIRDWDFFNMAIVPNHNNSVTHFIIHA